MTLARRTMIFAVAALAGLGAAACDRHGGEADNQAAAAALQSSQETAPAGRDVADSPPQHASVMRPSVVAETEPLAPPPPPEPFKATVLFGFGEASLGDDAKQTLAGVLKAAAASPQAAITLRGHTDSKGSDSDNKRMAAKRADAVKDYLVAQGVAEERVTTLSLGEMRPAAPNASLDGEDDEEGRHRNRRVDIVLAAPMPAPSGATGSPPPQ